MILERGGKARCPKRTLQWLSPPPTGIPNGKKVHTRKHYMRTKNQMNNHSNLILTSYQEKRHGRGLQRPSWFANTTTPPSPGSAVCQRERICMLAGGRVKWLWKFALEPSAALSQWNATHSRIQPAAMESAIRPALTRGNHPSQWSEPGFWIASPPQAKVLWGPK